MKNQITANFIISWGKEYSKYGQFECEENILRSREHIEIDKF